MSLTWSRAEIDDSRTCESKADPVQTNTHTSNIHLRLLKKETVSVISSNPPCIDGIIRYPTEPLKVLSDQDKLKNPCFRLYHIHFDLRDFCEKDLRISCH